MGPWAATIFSQTATSLSQQLQLYLPQLPHGNVISFAHHDAKLPFMAPIGSGQPVNTSHFNLKLNLLPIWGQT